MKKRIFYTVTLVCTLLVMHTNILCMKSLGSKGIERAEKSILLVEKKLLAGQQPTQPEFNQAVNACKQIPWFRTQTCQMLRQQIIAMQNINLVQQALNMNQRITPLMLVNLQQAQQIVPNYKPEVEERASKAIRDEAKTYIDEIEKRIENGLEVLEVPDNIGLLEHFRMVPGYKPELQALNLERLEENLRGLDPKVVEVELARIREETKPIFEGVKPPEYMLGGEDLKTYLNKLKKEEPITKLIKDIPEDIKKATGKKFLEYLEEKQEQVQKEAAKAVEKITEIEAGKIIEIFKGLQEKAVYISGSQIADKIKNMKSKGQPIDKGAIINFFVKEYEKEKPKFEIIKIKEKMPTPPSIKKLQEEQTRKSIIKKEPPKVYKPKLTFIEELKKQQPRKLEIDIELLLKIRRALRNQSLDATDTDIENIVKEKRIKEKIEDEKIKEIIENLKIKGKTFEFEKKEKEIRRPFFEELQLITTIRNSLKEKGIDKQILEIQKKIKEMKSKGEEITAKNIISSFEKEQK